MSEGRHPYRQSADGGVLCEVDGRLVPRRELKADLEARFHPLRPASTPRLVLAAVFGPLVWAICILLAVLLVEPTREVVLGGIIAGVCFVAAALVLSLMRWGRIREARERVGSS